MVVHEADQMGARLLHAFVKQDFKPVSCYMDAYIIVLYPMEPTRADWVLEDRLTFYVTGSDLEDEEEEEPLAIVESASVEGAIDVIADVLRSSYFFVE